MEAASMKQKIEATMNSYKTPGELPLKRATMIEDPKAGQTLPTTRPTPARVKRLKLGVISTACGRKKAQKSYCRSSSCTWPDALINSGLP
jgi:hypothetical protein